MHVEFTGKRDGSTSAVCVKWVDNAGRKEVSIAADDSCGAMWVMGRCEIRCYHDGKDVTVEVFNDKNVHASNADVRKALRWLGD